MTANEPDVHREQLVVRRMLQDVLGSEDAEDVIGGEERTRRRRRVDARTDPERLQRGGVVVSCPCHGEWRGDVQWCDYCENSNRKPGPFLGPLLLVLTIVLIILVS